MLGYLGPFFRNGTGEESAAGAWGIGFQSREISSGQPQTLLEALFLSRSRRAQ